MTTDKVLGPGLFSYVFAWKPKANDDGTEKYSVAFLWKKTDKKTTRLVKEGIRAAIEADAKGKRKLKGKTQGFKIPLRDGDKERPDKPEYKGMYFFNASSTNAPGIRDRDNQPITDQREFYSGCIGYIAVNFYAFGEKGNIGIAAGLNHLLKSKDGPPLSGGASAEQTFADIEIEDDEEDFDEDDEASEFF
jgi:hypothetical protein